MILVRIWDVIQTLLAIGFVDIEVPVNFLIKSYGNCGNNAPKEIVPELTPDEVYKFRRKLNMTQIEFGAMLHVKNVTVSHWERGHSFPGLKRCDEIRAICMKKISELEDKRKIDTDMEEL